MRRKTVFRAGLAGVTAAACYAAASEIKRSSPVPLRGMLLLAGGGLIGMATNSVMARTAQQRITTTVMPMLATHTTQIAATTSVANALVSGSTAAGTADGLNLGNGAVSSLFTGSESVGANAGSPPSQTSYAASTPAPAAYDQGDFTAYVNHINQCTTDIGAILGYLSAFASTYNNTTACVSYIQAELSSHNLSSN